MSTPAQQMLNKRNNARSTGFRTTLVIAGASVLTADGFTVNTNQVQSQGSILCTQRTADQCPAHMNAAEVRPTLSGDPITNGYERPIGDSYQKNRQNGLKNFVYGIQNGCYDAPDRKGDWSGWCTKQPQGLGSKLYRFQWNFTTNNLEYTLDSNGVKPFLDIVVQQKSGNAIPAYYDPDHSENGLRLTHDWQGGQCVNGTCATYCCQTACPENSYWGTHGGQCGQCRQAGPYAGSPKCNVLFQIMFYTNYDRYGNFTNRRQYLSWAADGALKMTYMTETLPANMFQHLQGNLGELLSLAVAYMPASEAQTGFCNQNDYLIILPTTQAQYVALMDKEGDNAAMVATTLQNDQYKCLNWSSGDSTLEVKTCNPNPTDSQCFSLGWWDGKDHGVEKGSMDSGSPFIGL